MSIQDGSVGQLDFGDFLAEIFLDDDNANAGNAELVPPQSWELEFEVKKSLGGWGTTTVRLYDHRIEDLVDFIPIGSNGESLGNIPSARRQGMEWTTTLKFDAIGLPGLRLDSGVQLERSRLKDPLTGKQRPISETHKRRVDLELRYDVPRDWVKREWRGHYRGQKQIWFLLRLVGRDCDVKLRASDHPEFDAWRWSEYWAPAEAVVEFKREVYRSALGELERFLAIGAESHRSCHPYMLAMRHGAGRT